MSSSGGGEVDKTQLIQSKYGSIWIGRFVKAGGLYCATHLALAGVLIIVSDILSIAYSGEGFKSDKDAFLGPIIFFRIILQALLSRWMLFICIICALQIWIFSGFFKITRVYYAKKLDAIMKVGGNKIGLLLAGVFVFGISNGALLHGYMTLMGMSWDESEAGGECSTKIGSFGFCWNTQYKIILFFSVLSTLYGLYSQYTTKGFMLRFLPVRISFEHSLRIVFGQTADDCVGLFSRTMEFCFFVMIIKIFCFIFPWVFWVFGVENFAVLLNARFLIHLVFWPQLALFSMNLCWNTVEAAFTDVLELPLESKYPTSTDIVVLSDSMMFGDQHMKHLGFFTFHKLACFASTNGQSFQQFYTLSHPGGHPRNWTGVLEAALKECVTLKLKVLDFVSWYNQRMIIPKPASSAKPSSSSKFTATLCEPTDNEETSSRRRTMGLSNMRDLTTPAVSIVEPMPHQKKNIFKMVPSILATMIKRMLTNFWNSWIAPHLTKFKTITEEKNCHIELANHLIEGAKLVQWGTNGVTEIACASMHADSNGVVQRDIRKIIETFVGLHNALTSVEGLSLCNSVTDEYLTSDFGRVDNIEIGMTLLRQLIRCCSHNLARIHYYFHPFYDVLGISPQITAKMFTISQGIPSK